MTTVCWRKIAVAGAVLIAVWGIFLKLPSEMIVYSQSKSNLVTKDTNEKSIEIINDNLKESENQSTKVKEKLFKQYITLLTTNGRYVEKKITNDLKMIDTGSYVIPEPNKHIIASRSNIQRPNIYSFKVEQKSAITAYELDQVFKGTGLYGLGKSFIKAELLYGVNAVFLSSLAIHESSWGNSDLSKYKNNLFGFGAYDRDPYNMAYSFASKDECILKVAKFISEQYIHGGYSTGGNIISIGKIYASDYDWPFKLWNTMIHIETASN